MTFDLATLRDALRVHDRVCRVVVAQTHGSTPREVGAAMLVWRDGPGWDQVGTIGGGALEFEALRRARDLLSEGGRRDLHRVALGPELGQCCGGAVTLLSEVFSGEDVQAIEPGSVFCRPCRAGAPRSLAVNGLLSRARATGLPPAPGLVDGWMIEPVNPARAPIWIYGAGHVGRALVNVITPLSDFVITWIETGPERFPASPPAGVATLPAARPDLLVRHAPANAHHLILTYSHALDLALCHAVLTRGFASAGLIGSATKWARFRKRLAALGHAPQQIVRITCPIGEPALGKHPQAIAIGVARDLIQMTAKAESQNANREERDDRVEIPSDCAADA